MKMKITRATKQTNTHKALLYKSYKRMREKKTLHINKTENRYSKMLCVVVFFVPALTLHVFHVQ